MKKNENINNLYVIKIITTLVIAFTLNAYGNGKHLVILQI
jgi:hypothetical protein